MGEKNDVKWLKNATTTDALASVHAWQQTPRESDNKHPKQEDISLTSSQRTKPPAMPHSIKSGCHWEAYHLLGARIKSDRQYALTTACTPFIAHYRFYTVPISLHGISGAWGNATISLWGLLQLMTSQITGDEMWNVSTVVASGLGSDGVENVLN